MKRDTATSSPPPTAPQGQVEEFKKRIAELEQQLIDKDSAYKRALADYQNLQRRTQEERMQFAKMAAGMVIEHLLEPLDHLEMTAHHLQDKGLDMVMKQLQQALEAEGLQEIGAMGQTFDHTLMEAGDVVEGPKDVVVRVRRKGYKLNGMILRPALVEVGNGK